MNMSDTDNLRPWFREDIARVLMSVYFATATSSQSFQSAPNDEFRRGFASALSSVAINIGLNPESFLAPDDIARLQTGSAKYKS